MNGVQVNCSPCPKVYLRPTNHVHRQRPLCLGNVSFSRSSRVQISYKVENRGYMRLSPVCLSRAEAGSGSGDKDPLWKSFGNAFENIGKKSSVEDLLKQQIENREYYKDDGPGGKPPGRGGGGGGRGGGDFEEEDFSGGLEEAIHVILATLGFIFSYAYILSGAEIERLVKDYIKYLFKGQKSVRLSRAMAKWEAFLKNLKRRRRRAKTDKFWLEKAIINTPTWWKHPNYKQIIIRNQLQKKSRSDYDD